MDIRTVTVLGANGTMGRNVSAIFASFGNAKVYMVSRELDSSKKAKAFSAATVRARVIEKNLIPVTYDDLERCIKESDIVFESVSEDISIKKDVLKKVDTLVNEDTIIGTGTSGISVNELSSVFSENTKKNFFGIHMYNPPYNMTLCEVTPSDYTDRGVMESTVSYLQDVLLRQVVTVKDTPAFMGNRIGFQFINHAMQYAQKYKDRGGIDYIDRIFGGFTGRAMPPLVTADFVGMDIHKAIVDNIYENAHDYCKEVYMLPQFAQELIDQNKLGRKTAEGLYRRRISEDGKKIREVYDINSKTYRAINRYKFGFIDLINDRLRIADYKGAMQILLNDKSEEGILCIQMLLDYIIFALHISLNFGEDIHSSDHVMATGFSWIPPLALVEVLSLVKPFEEIIKERLSVDNYKGVDLEAIMNKIEKSKYDYRQFLKVK